MALLFCAVACGESSLSVAPCAAQVAEGAHIAVGDEISATRARCETLVHSTAAARGMQLRVTLSQWEGRAVDFSATLIDGTPLAELQGAAAGATLEFVAPQSGEVLLHLMASPSAPANAYALRVECLEGCAADYTRYPIVLMHGFAGTDSYFGWVDYFTDVAQTLRERGYAVLVPKVDPIAGTPLRAQQWQTALDDYRAAGMARRFNLIAHSQGGLDARYLISILNYGGHVASLTTVSSPHHGAPIADLYIDGLGDSGIAQAALDAAADVYGELLGAGDQDLAQSVATMTGESMARFNAAVVDDPQVAYFSWAGKSCAPLDLLCRAHSNGEVVNAFMLPSYEVMKWLGYANDGIVTVDSARWGVYLGELFADHADEVGLSADLIRRFDHLEFYRAEGARLRRGGF